LVLAGDRVRVSAPWFLLFALMAAIYARVLIKLVHDWYTIPDFSQGFVIPLFVAYLVWKEREKLARTPVRPAWAGVAWVAVAMLVLLLGIYGAELFLTRFSLVLLMMGLVWTFAGAEMVGELALPLAVLLLAIPFPAILYNKITFPLQLLASNLASSMLPFFGVPVLREGNIIQLSAIQLEVAEACSGIRSLMTLFTVAVIYGYFAEKSLAKRWILALAALPIAVAANAVRIVGTGICVQYWNPDKALGFFHEFSGWLMFVISTICLYFVHRLLSLWRREKVAAP
jgi:exosortase